MREDTVRKKTYTAYEKKLHGGGAMLCFLSRGEAMLCFLSRGGAMLCAKEWRTKAEEWRENVAGAKRSYTVWIVAFRRSFAMLKKKLHIRGGLIWVRKCCRNRNYAVKRILVGGLAL